MNAKYTIGPWKVLPEEVDRNYIRVRGTAFGYRYKIANVVNPSCDHSPQPEAEETRANARLIAAAPELLEALETILEIGKRDMSNPKYNSCFDGAHAVILKARGLV